MRRSNVEKGEQELALNLTCDQYSNEVPDEYHLSIHIAREHPPYIKCDDCPLTASSQQELENHVSQKHKVKELFSCYLCDFNSEESSELKAHVTRNIHDISSQNLSFKEKPYSICHPWKYETKDEHVMKNH